MCSYRPRVIINCAVSLDACLADDSGERLILSNQADLARRDKLRAEVDAILIGAETLRRDNPRLTVPAAELQRQRLAQGLTAEPIRVVLSGRGLIDPQARIFSIGSGRRRIYCPAAVAVGLSEQLVGRAEVKGCSSNPVSIAELLADLKEQGVSRLLVEGGGQLIRQFLAVGCFDSLLVAIAPLVVGAKNAARLCGPAAAAVPLQLESAQALDGMVLLSYTPGSD